MGYPTNQKLKQPILFLINSLQVGGAERVFIHQAHKLQKYHFSIFFGVLKSGGDLTTTIHVNAGIFTFSMKHIFDISGYKSLVRFIKQHNIAMVYSTLDHANIVARVLKICKPSLRIVIRESGMANRKTFKIKFLDIILNFFCNKIIAVSNHVRGGLLSYQWIHKKKIVVLGNGVDIVMNKDEINKNNYNKDNEFFDILHVGSMNNDNKGQKELIDIVHRLWEDKKIINIRLTLVGDGVLRKKLEQEVKDRGLKDVVVFTGILEQTELGEYYKKSDIFFLNSKNEGCPNVVLEAMSFGLPVISTFVGGVEDMILHGKTGFLVRQEDRIKKEKYIVQLAQNQNERYSMGMESFNRVRDNFSADTNIDTLITILNSI